MRTVVLSLLLLKVLMPPGAYARQGSEVLRAETRVRMVLPSFRPSTLVGRLVLFDDDSIAIRSHLGTTSVPWGAVASLARSRGIHPGLRVVPPLIGAAAGAYVAATLFRPSGRCRLVENIDPDCRRVLSHEVVGAVWGGIILGLGARLIAPERWEQVPVEQLLRARAGDSYVDFGIALSW